jgi:UDP-glucose:(heptosyl)LPS alpha-1,3-glucosyltransferase
VLANGFSSNEFNLELRRIHRRVLRRRLGIPEEAWVVLFVANEWERKGLMPLLEAVALLRDRRVHVVAAGRLPAAMVLGRSQKLGIADRVHVVGPSGGVNRWFGMADVFALPTVYEAWGMVIIEALASGLPVLTSRCSGASVAVQEALNGVLLENPVDIQEIRRGFESLRKGVAWEPAKIRASVAEFEWDKILERYERILRSSV